MPVKNGLGRANDAFGKTVEKFSCIPFQDFYTSKGSTTAETLTLVTTALIELWRPSANQSSISLPQQKTSLE